MVQAGARSVRVSTREMIAFRDCTDVVRGEHLDQRGSQEGTGALRHDVQFDPRVEMKELVECRMHSAPRQLWTARLLSPRFSTERRAEFLMSRQKARPMPRASISIRLVECIAELPTRSSAASKIRSRTIHGTLDEIGAPEDGDRIDALRLPIFLGGYRVGDDSLGAFIAAGDPQQHLENGTAGASPGFAGFPAASTRQLRRSTVVLIDRSVARKSPGADECPVVEMDVVALQLVPRDRAGPDRTAEERADAMLAEGVFEGVRRRHAEAKHPAVDDAFRPVAIGPVSDAGQTLFAAVYGASSVEEVRRHSLPLGPPGIEDEESSLRRTRR